MSLPVPATCVELLQQMASFDTVNRVESGDPFAERALAERLEELAEGWGLSTARLPVEGDAFNLLVSATVDHDAPWVLFDSHLDTVGVEGMTVDPFAAAIVDDHVVGRGVCDTKGSGAAMLWALKSRAAEGGPAVNAAVLFSIDEEVSRTGVRAFLERQLKMLDWRPAAAIVGEPTKLKMVTAHNGLVRWRIHTRGRAAHSSDPSQGKSAISDMVRVIDAIETHYIPHLDAKHPMVGRAQCSINMIAGGQQINIIPDACTIALDRRLVPGEDPLTVLPAVERVLDSLRRDDAGLDVTQSTPRIELGLSPEANDELARRVGETLTSLGLSAEPVGAKYGTHASSFAAAGIPALVLGPGDIAQAHSKDEYLALDQLEQAERVYRELMARDAGF